MIRRYRIRILLLVFAACLAMHMVAETKPSAESVRDKADIDTTSFIAKGGRDLEQSRKMMSSAFPVDLKITGHAVRIQSDYNQMLPVYSASGALFMAMHLNKGTNWLNGLPRGHYFINSRPITIP